jgi:hypothetical protein
LDDLDNSDDINQNQDDNTFSKTIHASEFLCMKVKRVAGPSYTLSDNSKGDTHVALKADKVPNNSDGNSKNS